jgi:hypothetical protein
VSREAIIERLQKDQRQWVEDLHAENERLRAAIRHVINDSPGTPQSMKQFLTKALSEAPSTKGTGE